jgi:hypothetical protein
VHVSSFAAFCGSSGSLPNATAKAARRSASSVLVSTVHSASFCLTMRSIGPASFVGDVGFVGLGLKCQPQALHVHCSAAAFGFFRSVLLLLQIGQFAMLLPHWKKGPHSLTRKTSAATSRGLGSFILVRKPVTAALRWRGFRRAALLLVALRQRKTIAGQDWSAAAMRRGTIAP